MNRLFSVFLLATLSLGLLQTTSAQSTATQDVTITVNEITNFSVSGATVEFDFKSSNVSAVTSPASLTESRSYSLFTNASSAKITAKLGSDFSTGITLKAGLAPPSGGSASPVTLGTSATDLVTGISPTAGGGLNIDYTAEITPQAAPGTGTTETVTYTITAN